MAAHEFSADRDTMATPPELDGKEMPMGWHFLANSHAIPLAAIGHVDHVEPGHHLEQFAGHMRGRAGAERADADLARIGLDVADEFGDRFRRERWIGDHDERKIDQPGDRCDVSQQIELQIVEQRDVDRGGRGNEQ
jgi:hypothetical protein